MRAIAATAIRGKSGDGKRGTGGKRGSPDDVSPWLQCEAQTAP
jgi:hypothetical protein